MDKHPGDTSRNNERTDSYRLIHRSRVLREDSRRIAERAASARHCFDPPPSRDGAAFGGARLVLAGSDDRYVLVQVHGAIDSLSSHQFADVLARAVHGGAAAVIVDLSAVTLLSAAGLHCLDQAREQLAERAGSLHLVCPAGSPSERILCLFEPYRSQPWHPDVAAAAHSFMGL